jgi:hypothetical protein
MTLCHNNQEEDERTEQKEPCLACGETKGLIRVHGHVQCRACNAVLERCCDD